MIFYITSSLVFRNNIQLTIAIVHLVNEILKSFENNCYTLGVFIDLTKAFDTVDHNIVLKKLLHYGVRGNTLKLLQSYLQNRKKYIAYENSSKTEFKNVTCSVPQGSILAPLLFLIFINYICHSTPLLEAILFADDTNPFIHIISLKCHLALCMLN